MNFDEMRATGTVIQIEANEWVTEDLLMALTGMKRGTITRAAKNHGSWVASISMCHLKMIQSPPASACITAKRLMPG